MSSRTRLLSTFLLALLLTGTSETFGQTKRRERLREKIDEILPPEGWAVSKPKDANRTESFVVFKGRSCRIHTTVSPEAARDIGNFIDVYLHLFRRIFAAKFIIDSPLTVLVFGHQEEFEGRYRSVYSNPATRTRRAVYSPGTKETWIVLRGDGPKRVFPVETAKHELTHHMLHFFTGQTTLPPWFDEGFACFFQYWDVTATTERNIARNLSSAQGGDYGYFPRVILKEFGSDRFLPPSRLTALSYEEFHCADTRLERLHYSESWALVNFLTTTRTGQHFLNEVVKSLRKGRKGEKVLHPRTLASLEIAWYKDIEERLLPALRDKASARGED